MSDDEPVFRVDLDGGTASAEAPGHGQSFFRCRRGFRLPSGPIRIYSDEAHVTGIGVKHNIGDAI